MMAIIEMVSLSAEFVVESVRFFSNMNKEKSK